VREVAALIAAESQMVAALEQQATAARAYPAVFEAIERFKALAQTQRDALLDHYRTVGGTDTLLGAVPRELRPAIAAMVTAAQATERPCSTLLAADHTAFHDIAMAYGLLWISAHRAQAAPAPAGQPTTFRVAEKHQRGYAEAAQEIVRLIVDVLAQELEAGGQPCRCYCPFCAGMGLCICVAAGRDLLVTSWSETAVAPEQGIVVRTLRPGSLAERAGFCQGDAVVSVGGRDLPDVWGHSAIRAAVGALAAGEPLVFRVRRGEEEITIASPPPQFAS
jgi:hypothetical protein